MMFLPVCKDIELADRCSPVTHFFHQSLLTNAFYVKWSQIDKYG